MINELINDEELGSYVRAEYMLERISTGNFDESMNRAFGNILRMA